LVVRVPDRIDRRQNLIYLTNKGKRLQEELMRIYKDVSLEIQDGIDPEQLDIFRQVLTRIHNNLINS
ncbi:MAG: MarR family winged helix-turn-helix transcriptional regulator, partial [Candidatus Poribacteria bacterium]